MHTNCPITATDHHRQTKKINGKGINNTSWVWQLTSINPSTPMSERRESTAGQRQAWSTQQVPGRATQQNPINPPTTHTHTKKKPWRTGTPTNPRHRCKPGNGK